MRCGNRDVRPQTIHEGLWPGGGEAMGFWTCDRCGWTGTPLLMAPDEAARVAQSEGWDASPADDGPNVAEPASPARSRPVAGALLLLAAAAFFVPIYFAAVGGLLTGDPIAILGGVGVSGFSLLLGVAVGRAGWRMVRPPTGES